MTKEVKPTEARQGRRGTPVLVILIVGLLLALIVWWGVELYGDAIAPEEPVGSAPQEEQQPADTQ